MKYNWNCRSSDGELLPEAKVRDAHGEPIHWVMECDTETGYVKYGVPVGKRGTRFVEEHRPAPLTVEFAPDDMDIGKWLAME